MSKRIPIFVVTPDALVNMYKNNEEFNESNLVIFHEKRIPICKIFYKNVHIKANPYQLTGEKRNEAIAKNIFQYFFFGNMKVNTGRIKYGFSHFFHSQ